MQNPERIERAIIALHDFGSRPGATAKTVKRDMKRCGFTVEEIAQAAEVYGKPTCG